MTRRVAEALSSPLSTAAFRLLVAILGVIGTVAVWAAVAWLNQNYARAADVSAKTEALRLELKAEITETKNNQWSLEKRLISIETSVAQSNHQLNRIADRVERIGDRIGVNSPK